MRIVPNALRVVLRGGVLAGALLSGPAWGLSIQTVVLTGDLAPGAGGSATYNSFSTPTLNDAGQTAFVGFLDPGGGVTTSNDTGIWSGGAGSVALVAREGDVAPGTSSATYSGFNAPVLNDAGQTAFRGSLNQGGDVTTSNNSGIWSEGSGSLALVAREGSPAPGTSSADYRNFSHQALNDAGQTAFTGFLTGGSVTSSNDYGIWSEGSGSLALVAREGDVAPGTGSAVYSSLGTLVLNDAGQTVFRGVLNQGGDVNSSNDSGIWSGGAGSLALVAREGDVAPGTGSAVYSFLGSTPALNNAGETAFSGLVTGSGVNTSNNSGIWSGDAGGLALVARGGSPAPGTSATYGSFRNPVLNDSGQTAFQSSLTGGGVTLSNNFGIWSEGSGSLALVAREGDVAPGTGSAEYSRFDFLVLNDAGQTAFQGVLALGGDVNSSNDRGIWAQNSAGVLELIAREGDLLEVAPGDSRTVSFLAFVGSTSNSDGRRSGFNNSGELAFLANFTDGSRGIFLSSFDVQAPAPGTLGLLGMGLLGVMASARRGRRCCPGS